MRSALTVAVAAIIAVSAAACTQASPNVGRGGTGGVGGRSTTTSPRPTTTTTQSLEPPVPPLPPRFPAAAEVATWAAGGAACAPVSAEALNYGEHYKSLLLSAHLGAYTAVVSGLRNAGSVAYPFYEFRSPMVTVTDPAGTFRENLGSEIARGFTVFPRDVGPEPFGSPLCLARFDRSSPPVVLLGVGGPNGTHASSWAYVIGVAIGSRGISKPISDLPETGGGLYDSVGGQQLVFDSGHPLLLGANGAFEYAGSATAQPPVVLGFSGGRFVVVTRAHPSLVASSAAGFWKFWLEVSGNKSEVQSFGEIPLVAWAAVTCAVGKVKQVGGEFETLERKGWIPSSFVRFADKELIQTGYCPS
jgi:hypothetical protein